MPYFALSVKWKESTEELTLDFSTLQEGKEITTCEWGTDGKVRYYHPICESRSKPDVNPLVATIKYSPGGKHCGYGDSEVDWGTYEYLIDTAKLKATAQWMESPKANNINKRVTILGSDLFEPESKEVMKLRRIGQIKLKDDLMMLDRNQCAISGECCKEVLDAAHIKAHADGGAATVSNAMLLRADLHRLFDCGLLRIDHETGRVEILADEVPKDSYYWGAKAPRLKAETLQRVSEALKAHRHFTKLAD